MKLILLATLLSLTLANSLYLRAPGVQPISDSAPSCITDYYTALFAHFGLDQPSQILNCFDDKSAALYFTHLYQVTSLVQDAEARNKVKVHLDWVKLLLLHKQLEKVWGCIGSTEDLTKLLAALGTTERNPELWLLAKYIYYQANFGPLSESLPTVTSALDSKDFKTAGDAIANIINTTSSEIKTRGLALEALNGLWNGVHIGLELPDPQNVWSCWNNDTATVRLEFIYGMAAAVANGKQNDAAHNTEKWYQETGNELAKKIPDDAWKCWQQSDDTKAESAKLGVDITSDTFYERVSKFVHGHQAAYWHLQNAIKVSMEQHNFNHAGSAYAHLLQAAVKTN